MELFTFEMFCMSKLRLTEYYNIDFDSCLSFIFFL